MYHVERVARGLQSAAVRPRLSSASHATGTSWATQRSYGSKRRAWHIPKNSNKTKNKKKKKEEEEKGEKKKKKEEKEEKEEKAGPELSFFDRPPGRPRGEAANKPGPAVFLPPTTTIPVPTQINGVPVISRFQVSQLKREIEATETARTGRTTGTASLASPATPEPSEPPIPLVRFSATVSERVKDPDPGSMMVNAYSSATLKFSRLAEGTTAQHVVKAISDAADANKLSRKCAVVLASDQLQSGGVRVMFRYREGVRETLALVRQGGLPIAGPSGEAVQAVARVFKGSLIGARKLEPWGGYDPLLFKAPRRMGPYTEGSLVKRVSSDVFRAPPNFTGNLNLPSSFERATKTRDEAAAPLERSDDKRLDNE